MTAIQFREYAFYVNFDLYEPRKRNNFIFMVGNDTWFIAVVSLEMCVFNVCRVNMGNKSARNSQVIVLIKRVCCVSYTRFYMSAI